MSDTGTFAIAEGLEHNSSLKQLNLKVCGIGDEGVRTLGKALEKNDTLRELELWDNDNITKTGVSVLIECLKTNRGLLVLRFSEHLKSVGILDSLNAARRRNKAPIIDVCFE